MGVVKQWSFPQRRVHLVQYQYVLFYILLIGGCLRTQCTPPCLRAWLRPIQTDLSVELFSTRSLRSELSRGARCLFKVTGTDTEMFAKFRLHAVFPEIRDASEQTDTQTRRSQYFAPPRTCRSPVTIFTQTRAVLTNGHTGHVPRAPGIFLFLRGVVKYFLKTNYLIVDATARSFKH